MRTLMLNLDKIGFTTSFLCAVHCMFMPIIITFLPYIGFSFLASEIFEWIILITSCVLGISSICMGYKLHKNNKIAVMLSIGLILLFLGRYAHENNWGINGVLLLVGGGFTVALSHYFNNKLCNSCKVCHH